MALSLSLSLSSSLKTDTRTHTLARHREQLGEEKNPRGQCRESAREGRERENPAACFFELEMCPKIRLKRDKVGVGGFSFVARSFPLPFARTHTRTLTHTHSHTHTRTLSLASFFLDLMERRRRPQHIRQRHGTEQKMSKNTKKPKIGARLAGSNIFSDIGRMPAAVVGFR